jgi:uncharacterized protein Yka (UPF0111/DUF47 family)
VKRWFLPDMPDLLGLFRAQAAITERGIDQFASWSHGRAEAGDAVRASEHEADAAKRAVQSALRTAFTTPLDPEDLYELSERLDAFMNAAKNIVREAEVMAMAADPEMGVMSDHLAAAAHQLRRAVDALGDDDDAATAASDAAVKACRDLEHAYRPSMSNLLASDDLREVTGRRELYRRYSRAADAAEAVAERIWYAVVKSP